MAIGDFDIGGSSLGPTETDPPLLVDPDHMLAGWLALQRFKPVARRNSQIVETLRAVEQTQSDQSLQLDLRRQERRSLAIPNPGGFTVKETQDHAKI
jgi:hypothetical protein